MSWSERIKRNPSVLWDRCARGNDLICSVSGRSKLDGVRLWFVLHCRSAVIYTLHFCPSGKDSWLFQSNRHATSVSTCSNIILPDFVKQEMILVFTSWPLTHLFQLLSTNRAIKPFYLATWSVLLVDRSSWGGTRLCSCCICYVDRFYSQITAEVFKCAIKTNHGAYLALSAYVWFLLIVWLWRFSMSRARTDWFDSSI